MFRTDTHSFSSGSRTPMLIFDAHLDLSMNALDWNRDITLPAAEIRARSGEVRQEGSGQRDGLAGRDAARPDRALRRDADRPLHRARQHAARLAQPRDRLGADPGAARLVPRDGGGAADGGDRRSSEPRSPCRALDERSAGQCPDRLHPEPGRGGFDPDPAPPRARPCAGIARRRAGPLRTRPLCAGHACQRRPWSTRSRAARGDAPAQHHSRRHAPVR